MFHGPLTIPPHPATSRARSPPFLAQGVTVVVLCTGTVLMGNEAMKGGPRETLEQKMMRERMEDCENKAAAAAAISAAAAATKAS